MRAWIVAAVLMVANAATAAAQVELSNDGFDTGELATFHDGFVTGEIGASRFVAPDAGRQLLAVRFLFGPDTTRTITLRVWDDTAGGDSPGAELFSGDYEIAAATDVMFEIDLTADDVVVTEQFRVGIEVQHDGAPSIANDTDGLDAPARNFLLADGIGWGPSSDFLIAGDWIIRAVVSGDAAGGPDGGIPGGGDCAGNGDCDVGSYCDLANGVCTFDCREDSDCGADACNSLGQCVEGDGGGCCDAGGDPAPVALAALLLPVLFRRRRRAS